MYGAVRCGFLIIKPQTALHHGMRCIVACGAVRLCYFAGNFGVVFEFCAIYAVW